MFVVGAITVDVGLWVSERRGSQTDADLAALAGAYQLLDPGASAADAITQASNSLDANDEQQNASFAQPVVVDDSCFNQGDNDAVTVDVQHDSNALFFGIFGVAAPDIGAHAKACVGAANGPGNAVPFEVSDDPGPCFDTSSKPIFTAMCPIEGGAQSPNPRGLLDLDAPGNYCSDGGGSGDIENMIEFGASGTCLINTTGSCDPAINGPWYDCVAVQTGNPQKVLDGTNARISKDGQCDQNFGSPPDGVDSFSESVVKVFDTGNQYTSIYAPRDCDPTTDGTQMSPRLVTLIVLDTAPGPGNSGIPIKAFAGFYIAGCAHESVVVQSEADLSPYCGDQLVRQIPAHADDDLYVSALAPVAAPKTLNVIKHVIGGSSQASNFTITVTSAGHPSPASFPGAESPGTNVLLDAGSSYTVTESGPAGYLPTFSSGCTRNSIGNGDTCIITNTAIVPTASPTPTPTPGGTPSPTPGPGNNCPPGHCVVYGRFVNIILAGDSIGPPSDQTTAFGISLRE